MNRLRTAFIIGLTALVWVAAPAQAASPTSLGAKISSVVASKTPAKMHIGVRVDRLGTLPATIFEKNAADALKPASNQKLITSAAAVAVLGHNFTYTTVLATQGDDLVIIGSGDPSIGDPRVASVAEESITAIFHRWAEALKQKGITEIKGDLLFDDTIFETQYIHPNWTGKFNLQNWYAAPVGGLNFNDNCVDVVIKPSETMGEPASVKLMPDTPWTVLSNTTTTAKKGEPIIAGKGDGPMTISVSGKVSKPNSEASPFSLSIVGPGQFFAATCRTVLAAEGIKINGETKAQRVLTDDAMLPSTLNVMAVHKSQMADWLWRVNKSSLNMFAEALLKTLGCRYTASHGDKVVGSITTGRAALVTFLESLNIDYKPEWIDDGSGLSHENRTTAGTLVQVLAYMHRHPHFETFRKSLAVPGESPGTLRTRMKDLSKNVFAKTGMIGGVSSLSGYAVDASGQWYAFSVLCNDTDKAKGGIGAAKQLQEAVCRTIATWESTTTKPAK